MHRGALAIGTAVLLCASLGPAAHAKKSTDRQAEAADAMIDHLDSWEQINRFRKQYGHCDDGSIAEGMSAAVARKLVSHWDTLPALAGLIKQNRAMACRRPLVGVRLPASACWRPLLPLPHEKNA